MFICLSTPNTTRVEELSYRIMKRPSDVIMDIQGNKTRRSIGRWITHEGKLKYLVYTHNMSVEYIKNKKEQNFESYVNFDLDGITYNNIGCFNDILRTAFIGSYTGDMKEKSPIDINAPMMFEAHIGPFYSKPERIIGIFSNLGLDVKVDESFDKDLYINNIVLNGNMNFTEFLQKIYIGSLVLCPKQYVPYLNEDQINKIVNLTKNWISGIDQAEKLIYRVFKEKNACIKLYNEQIEQEYKIEIPKEERKQSIHEKRHEIIVEIIKKIGITNLNSIIEIGSGGGKLTRYMSNVFNDMGIASPKIIAIDNDERFSTFFKKYENIDFQLMNCLFPFPNKNFINNDVMILSEVYEHLDEIERKDFLKLILTFYVPKNIIFSVPNIEYTNYLKEKNLIKLGINYRHSEHKIEFTEELFENEIKESGLLEYYILHKMVDERLRKESDSPFVSFIYWLELDSSKNLNYSEELFNKMVNTFTGFKDDTFTITDDIVKKGYNCFHIFNKIDLNDIFYLGPTISPFMSSDSNQLENPRDIIDFYTEKGHTNFLIEQKYMGSRCHIAVCKSIEIAHSYHLKDIVTFISRKGTNLKDQIVLKYGEKIFQNIVDEISSLDFGDDIVILDTEMLPWNVTGERLIRKEFSLPGVASFIKRDAIANKYSIEDMKKYYRNSEKYIKSLNNYSKDADIEFRVFDIFRQSTIKYNDWNNISNVFYIIRKCKYLKQIDSIFFNSIDPLTYDHLEIFWNRINFDGSEGLVIKPINLDKNEYLAPCFKCRTKEYLRIIYGIDYTEPEIMETLNHSRNKIGKKMYESILEHRLNDQILMSFFNKDFDKRNKFVYGLYGRKEATNKYLDQTF